MIHPTFAFLGNMSIGEILIILLVVLLLFGAKRIPELARSLGKASREFKDARDGVLTELEKEPAPRKENEEKKSEEGKDC